MSCPNYYDLDIQDDKSYPNYYLDSLDESRLTAQTLISRYVSKIKKMEDQERDLEQNMALWGTDEVKAVARAEVRAIRAIILGYERLLQDVVVGPGQGRSDDLTINSLAFKQERKDY